MASDPRNRYRSERSRGHLGNDGLVLRAAIVCSFGQYFGQLAIFGLSSSSCAQSCLVSQFEQQR